MSAFNFFLVDRKSQLFSFNAKAIVLVNAVYSFSISSSVPQIFALKVERFPINNAKLWTFFALPNFKKAVPPKKLVLNLSCVPK